MKALTQFWLCSCCVCLCMAVQWRKALKSSRKPPSLLQSHTSKAVYSITGCQCHICNHNICPLNAHTAVISAFRLALIQSVTMEMTEEMVTCSSHNIYPVPQVTWATDPPSAQEALGNSTIKTTDHKGLLTVESALRILGHLSNYTYFCSFISADKTEVWTASWKNQGAFLVT